MKAQSTSVLFATSLFCIPAGAATISSSDLPAAIQSCISAGDCYLPNNTSAADVGNAAVFDFFDSVNSTPDSKYLVRYDLVAPSAYHVDSEYIDPSDDTRHTINSTSPFDGYLWLLVNDRYSLASGAHALTLYMDKVSPSIYTNYPAGSTINLTLTSTDLLDGSAYRKSGLDGFPIDEGSLGVNPEPVLLAEDPSWYLAELNLVYLVYAQNGGFADLDIDSLNPADGRALVFGATTYWANSFEATHGLAAETYYTQTPVPLPPAVWMFLAGLALLVKTSRRN
jgi:hypothetical protein